MPTIRLNVGLGRFGIIRPRRSDVQGNRAVSSLEMSVGRVRFSEIFAIMPVEGHAAEFFG